MGHFKSSLTLALLCDQLWKDENSEINEMERIIIIIMKVKRRRSQHLPIIITQYFSPNNEKSKKFEPTSAQM